MTTTQATFETQSLRSVADIASANGVELHQVWHAVNSGGIAPFKQLGRLRLFNAQQVQRIEQALGQTCHSAFHKRLT